MSNSYNIVFIGAGSSNIFSLLHLIKTRPEVIKEKKILIIDKGNDPYNRTAQEVTCGWIGAGAWCDCKLVLSTASGGELLDFLDPSIDIDNLENSLLDILKDNLETQYSILTPSTPAFFNTGNFKVLQNRVLHVGTDYGRLFATKVYNKLSKQENIQIKLLETVIDIKNLDSGWYKIITDKTCYFTEKVIYATGRAGAQTTNNIIKSLGINTIKKQPQVGIRVEVPYELTKQITDIYYDFKFYLQTPKGLVRSFCVSPQGEVVQEDFFDYKTFNGGSCKDFKTNYTNFGVLCSPNDINGFGPLEYQKLLAEKCTNLESNKAT